MAQEFASLRLGDARLDSRFQKVMQQFLERPGKSINSSSDNWAESKGAYRLFSNPRLSEEDILLAHRRSIGARIEAAPGKFLIAVQDTTILSYTMHFRTEGLGSVSMGTHAKSSRGVFLHTAYLLDEVGGPLGCAEQVMWSRAQVMPEDELGLSEKNRWKMALKSPSELARRHGKRIVHVADREADYWGLLSSITDLGDDFVIRAVKRWSARHMDHEPFICRVMKEAQDLGETSIELEVCRLDPKNKRLRSRKVENIRLRVLARALDLSATKYVLNKGHNPDLKVNVVRLLEIDPPADRDPIDWILKTSLPIENQEDCLRIAAIYKTRWQIENFHRILKAGCNVEKSRLEHVDRLKKIIASLSVVAWRIHQMTLLGRECPDLPCTLILNENEWKALYCKIHKSAQVPSIPPTLNQAMRWIAQLGGFLGRKGDGNPGATTIWRGWERLMDMAELFEIMTTEQHPAISG